MLESEIDFYNCNYLSRMSLTLNVIYRHVEGVYDYEWHDFINLFTNKEQIPKQSEVIDRFLEIYFGTSFIISIMNDSTTLFNNEIPQSVRDKNLLYTEWKRIYIADIFPDKKSYHLYKLKNYDRLTGCYNHFFDPEYLEKLTNDTILNKKKR